MRKSFFAIVFIALFLLSGQCHAEEEYAYDHRGKRDPFVPLVGVTTATTSGALEDVASVEEVVFQGIVVDTKGKRAAMLNDEMVSVGETVGRVTVVNVTRNVVKFTIDDGEYELSLYQEE